MLNTISLNLQRKKAAIFRTFLTLLLVEKLTRVLLCYRRKTNSREGTGHETNKSNFRKQYSSPKAAKPLMKVQYDVTELQAERANLVAQDEGTNYDVNLNVSVNTFNKRIMSMTKVQHSYF